jgi:hypothetical protein
MAASPERLSDVSRPRIYGSEAKCRSAVARYVERGDALLDQVVGVRKRVEAAAAAGEDPFSTAFFIESEWAKEVRRWFENAQKTMGPFLQDQFEDVLGVIARGLPPATGKLRHAVVLDNGEPWLRKTVDELKALRSAVGVRRGIAAAAPAPARFEELHASGLVDEKVIDDRAKEMSDRREGVNPLRSSWREDAPEFMRAYAQAPVHRPGNVALRGSCRGTV